mgnify:CR=1 FL=1
MSILRVKVQNSLIIRAFTEGVVIMHEITEGIPKTYGLINIEYGAQHSTFWFALGDERDGTVTDAKVVYAAIKTLE